MFSKSLSEIGDPGRCILIFLIIWFNAATHRQYSNLGSMNLQVILAFKGCSECPYK